MFQPSQAHIWAILSFSGPKLLGTSCPTINNIFEMIFSDKTLITCTIFKKQNDQSFIHTFHIYNKFFLEFCKIIPKNS